MKHLSKHDVNKLTTNELKKLLPFELISDGEIVAVLVPYHDVNKLREKPKAKHDVNKLTELRFSKSAQARGHMR